MDYLMLVVVPEETLVERHAADEVLLLLVGRPRIHLLHLLVLLYRHTPTGSFS